MNIQKKPGHFVTLLAAAVFLLQSCATIVKGTSQKIPVTSAPIGAKVLVDGTEMGTTPLMLKLNKKKPGVIRIEKEGFNPHEIRLVRRRSHAAWFILGNIGLAFLVGMSVGARTESDAEAALAGTSLILGGIPIFMLLDSGLGGRHALFPTSLDIVLTPAGVEPRLDVTEIDGARLRDVKWLRIMTAAALDRY